MDQQSGAPSDNPSGAPSEGSKGEFSCLFKLLQAVPWLEAGIALTSASTVTSLSMTDPPASLY